MMHDALHPVISSERIGRVMVATLSRRPVNALDDELIARLEAVLDQVADDTEIAVLHVRSSEKVFCAGADLATMHSCFTAPGGPGKMIEMVRRMQRLFERIENAAVITLAEVGGAALGGGLELALACDLRAAAAEARLGLPEVSLGLLPAAGGTQRLTRLCGEGNAKRVILAAETIDGVEAQRLGIVQWVQPRERLALWTRELAAHIASMPKAALVASKRCIAAAVDPGRNGFAEEIAATRDLYAHTETRRRVSEFLDRNATRQKETR